MFAKRMFLFITLLFSTLFIHAQQVSEPTGTNPDWSKPFPPFQIAGNLYYVGTYDLACYLIVTPQGNILINTGLAASASMIKANIETLGFKPADIKILLNTQAHYDHLGAMAAIKKMTGAKLMIDAGDAAVVADGGFSDYSMGGKVRMFAPVKVDKVLHDGDTIRLGGMKLAMLHHPGHTKGSCSFLFDVKDTMRSYRVLIANIPTIVTDSSFDHLSTYPHISKDYAHTLKSMKNLTFDIWVASHASQFDLEKKHPAGSGYNPAAFMDRKGYDAEINYCEEQYLKKIKAK